jgi:hypothetical protein
MNIVFFCQSCGARFAVDAHVAGKQGRCKQCGQRMTVPRADQIASMAAMPALATAGGAAGAVAAAPPGGNWLAQMTSKVGLVPLTVDRMPKIFKKRPSPLDDALGDGKPYELVKPARRAPGARSSGPANAVVIAWRGQLGHVMKLLRWINQAAYLLSVPFIMLLLLGATVHNWSMAIWGATMVVLLNIARLVSGIANVAVIPFRDGIALKKMKKPLRRVIEPVITIMLVILAFAFIPWLSRGGDTGKKSISERVRESAHDLKQEIKSKVARAADKVKQAGASVDEKDNPP